MSSNSVMSALVLLVTNYLLLTVVLVKSCSSMAAMSSMELEGLSDKECAEAVAKSFAAVSQEYDRLDRTKLPSFLPAGRPEKMNVFQVVEKIKRTKPRQSVPNSWS